VLNNGEQRIYGIVCLCVGFCRALSQKSPIKDYRSLFQKSPTKETIMANREYIASCVCVSGFVPNGLGVSVLKSSVCLVSLEMRRPSKSLATRRVSLRHLL